MSGTVLFYVQHLLGIGHLRRALRIVRALGREGIGVTLVSGGEPLAEIHRAGAARVVQLPPVRAADAGFTALIDSAGRPVDDALWQARRAALLAGYAATRPDGVLFETYPFGRRAFWPEIDSLIAASRAARPRAPLLSLVRDIVVASDRPARRRAIVARVRRDIDTVLVHGDPAFIPLAASFPEACEIADRLVYTGYVGDGEDDAAAEGDAGADEVVVSAGGGAFGLPLLRAAIAARRAGCLAALHWRVLAGPNLPAAEFAMLCAALPEGVALERYRPDFPWLLRRCRVSVSQGGYNTVLDILAAGAAAVVVPFAAGRETEQLVRAERLAALGAIELVRESELSPRTLAAAIERAAVRRPAPVAIDRGGAARSARLIAAMLRPSSSRPAALVAAGRQSMIAR